MKSLFYPAHHFSEPLLSDMQGGKGGIYEHMEESGGGFVEWETQRTVIELCVKP